MSNTQTEFFYKWAGYGYNPKTETKEQGRRAGAKRLAKAEAYAVDHEWYYEWQPSQNPDTSWMDAEQLVDYETGRLEMLDVVLRDAEGKILESLGEVALYPDAASRLALLKPSLLSKR